MACTKLIPLLFCLVISVSFTAAENSNGTELCEDVAVINKDLDTIALCIKCVQTNFTQENFCIFDLTAFESGSSCGETSKATEFSSGEATNKTECEKLVIPTTPTTTTSPNTTNSTTTTTVPPSTTNSTTTTTTALPTTNATTTTTSTPTKPTSTTTAPTSSPKTTVAPTPAPSGGGINWGSFFGGIAFTAGVSSVAYVVWRFYKARTERNYHTFPATSRFASFC